MAGNKHALTRYRLTIILLSILSLFSCDRDNDNELTVPDLDKPTATTQLTVFSYGDYLNRSSNTVCWASLLTSSMLPL